KVRTQYVGVTFKHLLLPVWVAVYRYRDKVFRILVNARTGEVQGERPYSWVKIALLVLAILLIGAVVLIFASRGQGAPISNASQKRSAARFCEALLTTGGHGSPATLRSAHSAVTSTKNKPIVHHERYSGCSNTCVRVADWLTSSSISSTAFSGVN